MDNRITSMLMEAPFCFALHKITDDKKKNTTEFEFVGVNPAFERTFGVRNELLAGKTLSQLFQTTNEVNSAWRGIYDRIAAVNGAAGFEHHVTHLGKWFKVNAWQTDDNHFAITLTDITAGLQPMETSCLNDVQQPAFWNNNLFGIMITDKDGKYVDANEEACRMTAYSCEELKSMTLFHLIAPEHIEDARAHFKQTGNTGKAYGEVAYYTKSGEKRWWNVVATRLSDNYFLGFHEDITSRKQAEDAQVRREERLQKQNNTLLALMSGGTLFQSNLQQAISQITESCSENIDAERISVWLYSEDHTEIRCIDVFNKSNRQHTNNCEILRCDDYPGYFAIQKEGKVIDAVDVFSDPRTSELPAAYFEKHNIRSTLSTPVWIHDSPGAMLCFEHTGEQRVWTSEDVKSALGIAALLSLCFQNDERRKTEEAFRQNRNMLDTILNTIPQSVFWKDKEHRYLGCNRQFAKAAGLQNPEDIIGKTDFDLPWPEEEAVAYRDADHYVMENNFTKSHIIEPLQIADGSRLWIDTTKIPLLDRHGIVYGVLGVYEDITLRKRTEDERESAMQMLQSALAQSPSGILIADAPDVRIRWANQAALHIRGESETLLTGVDISKHSASWQTFRLDSTPMPSEELPLSRAILKGETVRNEEIIIRNTTGEDRYVSANSAPIRNAAGDITAGIVVFHDITERKQAEQKLEASQKTTAKLNTLLNAILESPQDLVVFALDADFCYTAFTKAHKMVMKNLWGADINVGDNMLDYIILEEDRNKAQNNLKRCLSGEFFILEEEYGDSSLQRTFYETRYSPLFNELHEIIGLTVFNIDITSRKKADEVLKTEQMRLAGIIEGTFVGTWEWNVQTGEIVLNERWADIIGYSLEEISPVSVATWKKFSHPDDLIKSEELLNKHFNGELNYYEFESRMLHKSGEWVWVLNRGKVVRWTADGKPLIMLGTHQDITERKRAEEEIKASEKKYQELSTLMRLLADNMPDMLWAKNLNKEYIFANKAICRNLLSAVDTEEPLGKTDMFFAMRQRNSQPENPDWHTFGEICRDSDFITLEAMKPMQFDEFGNVKGKFLFLDVHKAPLYNEQGQLIGVVGSARDVTKAKEAENQLRKLSLAVEQSPASVIITDPQGNIEYVNPKFTEVTGYTLEETVGQNPKILKSGEQSAELYAELWDTISSGKEWKGEFQNKKKNGELFWESALITSITNEEGEILHYLAVKEDITERKALEVRLIHQTRLRELLMDVSSGFINIPFDKVEKSINEALGKMGRFVNADRAYTFDYDWENEVCHNTYEWCNKGISAQIQNLQNLPVALIMEEVEEHKKGNTVCISDVSAMPEGRAKEIVESQGVLSFIMVPMMNAGKCIGFVGFDSVCEHHDYSQTEIHLLRLFAQSLANVKLRQTIEEQLVSAKLRAEESEENHRRLIEQMLEGLVVDDGNGIILFANPMFCKMTGYDEHELIGKSVYGLMLKTEDIDNVRQKNEDRKRNIADQYELDVVTKSGEIRTFWFHATPVTDKNGNVTASMSTITDITERKKLELARKIQINIAQSIHTSKTTSELLEIVRQELGRLFDTTNFFVAIYEPEKDSLKQLLFHDEMDNYNEWPASDSLSGQVVKSGKTIFLRGNEMDAFSKQHNLEVIGTDSACWLGVPVVINNQVGGVMVIQHYTNPEAYSIADVALLEMVALETGIYLEKQTMIEDMIKAKDQAEESDRLKSAFLANMSHEIRTPMNGILGFAELLKEPGLTGSVQQAYIAIIEKSGQRLLNIINDIVDISKIEAGVMELRMSESNINEQIDYIHNFFRPEADAKGLKFIIKSTLAQNEATIVTDCEKLYAILTNLIKNAIKYTHAGEIELGCMHKGDVLEFFVKDTGIGIPKNRQEAVFKRFVQADIEDKMAYQGAGLGLAITKAYIEMLEGKIWIESEEGKGSTFYFTLPCNKQ